MLIFLAATLAPLAATVWVTTSLIQENLNFATTNQVDALSRSLQRLGREYYQHVSDELRREAEGDKGDRIKPGPQASLKYLPADRAHWPEAVKDFAASGAADHFSLAGKDGDRLEYLVRHGEEVWQYSAELGEIGMERLRNEIREARAEVDAVQRVDVRRGSTLTFLLLAAGIWLVSMALLMYLAHRVSRPIQELTAGLAKLAAGDLSVRVEQRTDDEAGRAIGAFNDMAARLQESTERLVYLRQLESWQSLARKTAHEVKNSLTPIRLTVEEMLARYDEADRAFMEQATQIVVEEIETLERRVRAFSQFAAEPPVSPAEVDVNSLLEERIAFLKNAHPEVAYDCRLANGVPLVRADQDLLKGILNNLLENAADAAGAGGKILGVTSAANGRVTIEIHDSGPGLSEQSRASLFQPTISFKKKGMGLGLSIARKSALLSGGDIVLVKGELGGAAFRVLLPATANGFQAHPDRG